jgi:hypothetical protein
MKHIYLLFFTALTLGFNANAQIENSDFESWTSTPSYSSPDVAPSSFVSTNELMFDQLGLVTVTEVPGVEGSAIRVESSEFEGEVLGGFAVLGNVPEGDDLIFSDGFPFFEMGVTGLTVDLRHSITTESPGFMMVQFLFEGVPVTGGQDNSGTYFFPLVGESLVWYNTTFDFTSDPITQVPDECVIAFACNDVIDESGFAGDFLEVDNLMLNGVMTLVPGGDFNTWIEVEPTLQLDDWETVLPTYLSFITQSEMSFEGDYAVALTTLDIEDGFPTQSMIFQGEIGDDEVIPTVPIPAGGTSVNFQYQYTTPGIDSAIVYLLFSEVENPMPEDLGFIVENLYPTEGWTSHELNFGDLMPNAGYLAVIFMSSGGFDDEGVVGSTLMLDAIEIEVAEVCDYVPTISGGDITPCPLETYELTTEVYDEYNWYVSVDGEDDFVWYADNQALDATGIDAEEIDVYVETVLDGCETISEVITINYIELELEISADGLTELDICNDEVFTVSLENSDGYSDFQWELSGFPVDDETETSYTGTGSSETAFSITLIAFADACPDVEVTSNVVELLAHEDPSPEISVDGNDLSASDAYETYQWYLDGSEIDDATNSSILAAEDGTYTVLVTDDLGCEGESEDLVFIIDSVKEFDLELVIYPIPVSTTLNVNSTSNAVKKLEIVNATGQMVSSKQTTELNTQLDVREFSNGFYFLRLTSGDSVSVTKFTVSH